MWFFMKKKKICKFASKSSAYVKVRMIFVLIFFCTELCGAVTSNSKPYIRRSIKKKRQLRHDTKHSTWYFKHCKKRTAKKSRVKPSYQWIKEFYESELCHRIFLQVCKSSCWAYVIASTTSFSEKWYVWQRARVSDSVCKMQLKDKNWNVNRKIWKICRRGDEQNEK